MHGYWSRCYSSLSPASASPSVRGSRKRHQTQTFFPLVFLLTALRPGTHTPRFPSHPRPMRWPSIRLPAPAALPPHTHSLFLHLNCLPIRPLCPRRQLPVCRPVLNARHSFTLDTVPARRTSQLRNRTCPRPGAPRVKRRLLLQQQTAFSFSSTTAAALAAIVWGVEIREWQHSNRCVYNRTTSSPRRPPAPGWTTSIYRPQLTCGAYTALSSHWSLCNFIQWTRGPALQIPGRHPYLLHPDPSPFAMSSSGTCLRFPAIWGRSAIWTQVR